MKKIAVLVCASLAFAARGAEMTATMAGCLEIPSPRCTLEPKAFLPSWEGLTGSGSLSPLADGSYPFSIKKGADELVKGQARFAQPLKGAPVEAVYVFTPTRDVELNTLYVGLSLGVDALAGGTWQSDKGKGVIPREKGALGVFSDTVTTLTLSANNRDLIFLFPEPTWVMLQDDRQWGPTFSLRIGHSGLRTYKAGEAVAVRFKVSTHESPDLVLDAPVKIVAGADWIPLNAELDIEAGSALDFSALGLHDAPAGKHGYTLAKGARFEFEKKPGVAQRFYGVNFCFSANVPDAETATRVGRRLARVGYNAVRVHHHEGALIEGSRDGTTINAAQLAKFDALMAAFIENGIYLTTDLFVSRPVPWRSVGIERDGNVPMDAYKILVAVHDGAWENLKTFSRQWLLHVNPHTGRAYAQEPALAWLAITNEGNFGNFLNYMKEIPEWQQEWAKWLAERQRAEPEAYKDIDATLPDNIWARNRKVAAFTLFLDEMEQRFVKRARAFLRDEMKCRALITNRSSWTNFAVDQISREEVYDFVDDHFYVDHPRFLEQSWRLPSACDNVNPIRTRDMGAQGIVYTRLLNKPFTVTEYNFSAPGQFRGIGGIVTGTLGALQDWGGIWRFAYSHNINGLQGSHAPAMNYFDMIGDPLSLAAERASICLYLRGDLAPLKQTYAITIPKKEVTRMTGDMPQLKMQWPWLAWHAKLGTIVADRPPADATWSKAFPDAFRTPADDIRALLNEGNREVPLNGVATSALRLDRDLGTFTVTTPKTCGGFAETGATDADALIFDVEGTPATVWVSALDDAPIRTSKRLLLTHLTDIQNSGIEYAQRSRKTLLAWGGLPHLVRNGKAEIRLAVASPEACKVYALSSSGKREAPIPTHVVKGRLAFTAAVDAVPKTATLLYEIVKE
ncbi:MAG: hypothetical protein FWG50_12200 [Kiritimatiellaeota bacterium]|nr:hypothetical protein [Kiritimatiellota bacterium]